MKQTTRTRLWIGYNVVAFPLVLLCILILFLNISMWELREIGPVEGPEPSIAQFWMFLVCTVVFVAVYIMTIVMHRRSPVLLPDWVKFGSPIPSLCGMIALVMGLPTMSLLEKLIMGAYPILLMGILSIGLWDTACRKRSYAPKNRT